MLNIVTRISISSRSRIDIRNLKITQGGNFDSKSWGKISSSVKNEISKKLFANQGLKCVYCERYLIGLGHEIDHFAHKGDYPEFTFIPINLFYTCKTCNAAGRKGQKVTIDVLNNRYNQCQFLIVHPLLNIPDNEIRYLDADRIYFDRLNSTLLGNTTIDFFGWDDMLYSTFRSRELMYNKLHPLTTIDERKLIQLAIAYKK